MVKTGCYYPFTKKGDITPIPCGRCLLCRKRRANHWCFRLMQEFKASDSALFITLTYNDSNVPFTEKHGRLSLSKKHLQDFFKRLRKAHERYKEPTHVNQRGKLVRSKSIKYYAVGEYGSRTFRPHYHLLLFNCKHELIQNAWKNPLTGKHIGRVDYGDDRGFTAACVGYCTQYISKPAYIGKADWDDRVPEFALMSKGLGKAYLSAEVIKYHRADIPNRQFVTLEGGAKVSMPRYYKLKLFTDEERELSLSASLEVQIKEQLKYLYATDIKQQLADKRNLHEARIDSLRIMRKKTKHKL